MDENNPLFDLCKIKIELLFLNENFTNLHNYEKELIFYMNKYLWRIEMDTQPPNTTKDERDSEKSSRFTFFEFYTKYLNIKTSNISDTSLLTNKTDFYCNLLFIFEQKEELNKNEEIKYDLMKILLNRNTPKELSHLLIICNDNLDLGFLSNILDKNTYDKISLWEIGNIKKIHKNLEHVLKDIIIKYRIHALNQKIDVNIKDKNFIDENLKIRKNLDILDAYIKIGNYTKSIEHLEELKKTFKIPKELCLLNEYNVVINFLIDYNNDFIDDTNNKMKYKKEIENNFLKVIDDYRNLNQLYLMVNSYLKLLYYLSYFNSIEMKPRISEIIFNLIKEKLHDESKSKLVSNIKFLAYLNISHIYNKINFKRKFFFFLYKAYHNYSKNYNKNDLYGNSSYIDLLIKNIEKYFMNKNNNNNINDIMNYYNYNYETFLELSKIVKLSHYNPRKFIYAKDLNNKNANENDDIDKGPLFVSSIFEGYEQVLQHIRWVKIQMPIYNDLIAYYKGIKNYDKTTFYSLLLLQICNNILNKENQNKYINFIQKKSSKIKFINSYNVVNIPFLLKIIPQRADIKFDFPENIEELKDDLFIYNPWIKKNEDICYYWTLNSIQTIKFHLYNPLNVEISIYQIQLIYDCKNKNNKNNNLFNFFPCSIILPPNQLIEYNYKFKPLKEETFDIIGVEYYLEGVKIKQYIKKDGNGLLFRYINRVENLFNAKIKDNISLNNIKIYPEIPLVQLIPLNEELIEDTSLALFLFQKYKFNFEIHNLSNKSIKEINLVVYAYKKEDYKITLYEGILKDDNNKEYIEPNKSRQFSYDFIQKKSYIHIEFMFYYTFEDENNKNKIKPYLYFKKRLKYKNIFSFTDPEIVPIYSNINFKKILSLEKNYSKYFTSIISNNFYFSFILNFLSTNKIILYEIYCFNKEEDKNILLDKGEFQNKKTLKIFIDKSNKLSNEYIKWKIKDSNIEGVINCFDLLRNIFNIKVQQIFDFNIIKNVYEDFVEFIYEVKNNDKFSYFNMKLKILIYQEDNKNLNMSISLDDNIFVDGQMIHLIEEIKTQEKVSKKIKLFPKKGIIFNTTFLLIDQCKGVLYMPSFFISHK